MNNYMPQNNDVITYPCISWSLSLFKWWCFVSTYGVILNYMGNKKILYYGSYTQLKHDIGHWRRSIEPALQFYIAPVVFKPQSRVALRDLPRSGFGYYLSPALPRIWAPAVNWARLKAERHATGVALQWTRLLHIQPDWPTYGTSYTFTWPQPTVEPTWKGPLHRQFIIWPWNFQVKVTAEFNDFFQLM